MTDILPLQKPSGDQFYPQTHIDAVVDTYKTAGALYRVTDFNFRSGLPMHTFYQQSERISGLTLSAGSFSLGAGNMILNGDYLHQAVTSNIFQASPQLKVDNRDIKDPFIFLDDAIYYLLFTQNGGIGYALSTDAVNWTYKDLLIDHADAWGGDNGEAWAPCVIKKGDTYYCFITGTVDGKGYCTGFLTSKSLNSDWRWGDYIRDSSGGIIDSLDPNITVIDGIYYMTCTGPDDNSINLWQSTDLSTWEFIKTLLTIAETWEGTVMEAPTLAKINDLYYLYYGANNSGVNQRIGLAVADKIDGIYHRVGINGMLLLDYPGAAAGSIAHPNIFIKDNRWYLYACAVVPGNGGFLIGYTSLDLINWAPIATADGLIKGTDQYIYLNSNGQLMTATDLPNRDESNSASGYLLLYRAAVDGSGNITAVEESYNINQITKASIGLGNVDNTSDTNKPVSTAQAAAIAALKAITQNSKITADSGGYFLLTTTGDDTFAKLKTLSAGIHTIYLKSGITNSLPNNSYGKGYALVENPGQTMHVLVTTDQGDVYTNYCSSGTFGAWNKVNNAAADILTKLKTVDGSGSGLDADLLDNHDSSYFLPATGTAPAASKLATARTISLTGDGTASGSFDGSANLALVLVLAASGVTTGTYKSVTVDAKGRVTSGTNPTTLAGYGITDAAKKTDIPTKLSQLNDDIGASDSGDIDGGVW